MGTAEPVYDVEAARALLPEIRGTLLALAVERRGYAASHAALHAVRGGAEEDDAPVRAQEADTADRRDRVRSLLELLEQRGVQVRDLDAGLVDIPTLRDGEPAWLCWSLADPELAYWHTPQEGFSSRRPL